VSGEREEAPASGRRATAESMAAQQRSISVSEFFTKNRHLLGFDNPRKALLTTVKEAVDNSLDACEEAGIVPEIWVQITPTNNSRFKVAIQDNGPGIVKKQVPLIFGKLLYGSKFHRLRMSRGQQGIGISAAGMYGQLTTGKPIKIVSKTHKTKPAHYFEIHINTKTNSPDILNGKGEGEDIPPGDKGQAYCQKNEIEWINDYPLENPEDKPQPIASGTRVTIELEGQHKRGKGSVDEFLEQTAIANPHVTIHYWDPEGQSRTWRRATRTLPPEPKEIKPHPYGVELGRLMTMIKEQPTSTTLSAFLTENFSRVSAGVARKICETAKLSTRSTLKKIAQSDVDKLFQAIQETKIAAPATDCLVPIGEPLLLQGLYQVVPGEFFTVASRPPAVYRGNPFLIEVGLAYGGTVSTKKVNKEELVALLNETDARTVKQFLVSTFDGLGPDGADKIISASGIGTRQNPSKLKRTEVEELFTAMQDVSVSETQQMQLYRYANRVPLQFKMGDCLVTKTASSLNWRSYGLSQSRGALPNGPLTLMVHVASVWVPFTSESKEAIASYDEIEKEVRLAVQTVGRRLSAFLRLRSNIRQEGERRNIFLRYLGEVAAAVSDINGFNRGQLYEELLAVAQKKTREADTKLDKHGKRVTDEAELNSDNVLIVETPLLAGEGLSTGGAATGKGQVHDTEAVRSLKKKGAPRAPRTKREKTKRTKR
jgi:DNA topoisomerase-6 subunit B